jgi:N-acetylglucosamine-6-phosphate deacetylase
MSRPARHAAAADHVFDGTAVHRDASVLMEGARILDVIARADVPAGIDMRVMPPGAWLAPGFIDLQVNGGGDVLFNDSPTASGILTIAAAHRRFGTTSLLPTLITDAPEKMKSAIGAAQTAMDKNPGVLGIHLEGPFLSPSKPGVHAVRFIRAPGPPDIELLTARRKGVTLVTLAPERTPKGTIAQLEGAGLRTSLGHSVATYEQTRAAMAEGLKGFTHLFNAMPSLLSREPGPVGAALESADAFYGLIVDGVHVDPSVLRLAVRGAGHPMLVTDAMPPVGGSQRGFKLYGEEIVAGADRCTRKDGTLAGAILTMAKAVDNCVRMLGVRLEDALRFASTNPAEFIGLGRELGRLAAGYRADLVAFEPNRMKVLHTWVAGRDA